MFGVSRRQENYQLWSIDHGKIQGNSERANKIHLDSNENANTGFRKAFTVYLGINIIGRRWLTSRSNTSNKWLTFREP